MASQSQLRVPSGGIVRVSVPVETYFNLEKIQQIQKTILGRLGCQACCSGFRINFVPELDFAVDEKLNIRTVTGLRDEEI